MSFTYRKKNREKQIEEVKLSLEALVTEKQILRVIDKAIDFSFIYEEVEGLYSEKERPCIDPVSLFSTFGKNYVRRFADTDIFERILSEAEKSGYVDASAVFIDSTHGRTLTLFCLQCANGLR